jgi:acyl-CoA synthetase (AMP-forming)/AMP-acid ligase II
MGLTLRTAIGGSGASTAVIVPAQAGSAAVSVSYNSLIAQTQTFQQTLASLGIKRQSIVSITLGNSLEFIVAFLAASWQGAVAAPLNPAYKQDEFEFYIDDIKSDLVLVPKGAWDANAASVRAAKKYNAAVVECYCDPRNRERVVLDVKTLGKLAGQSSPVLQASSDDVALILHTR